MRTQSLDLIVPAHPIERLHLSRLLARHRHVRSFAFLYAPREELFGLREHRCHRHLPLGLLRFDLIRSLPLRSHSRNDLIFEQADLLRPGQVPGAYAGQKRYEGA